VLIEGAIKITFHVSETPQVVTLRKAGDYVVFELMLDQPECRLANDPTSQTGFCRGPNVPARRAEL
jgi:hypothetical protein